MSKISPNFTLNEWTRSRSARKLGITNRVELIHLANVTKTSYTLERIRTRIGAPLIISSGYRTKELNERIGGNKNSAHCKGLAADIHTSDMTCLELAKAIRASGIPFDQLIYETDWVHIGLRTGKRKNRQEVLTAVFEEGEKTRYISGLE